MTKTRHLRFLGRGLLYAGGIGAGAYAAMAAPTWLRFGRVGPGADRDQDALLERFMPRYEVVERHELRVKAPPDITFAAMRGVDFQRSAVIRTIFRTRELLLGADEDAATHPAGLLALTQSLGWGVLAETAGREIVMGAVTQPWHANVVFRALPPDRFAGFDEPDFVKIVWNLRIDPIGPDETLARTETRVLTTDAGARRKFRRYWSFVAPGTALIRWMALRLARTDAERQAMPAVWEKAS
jgi:hypothetical protein